MGVTFRLFCVWTQVQKRFITNFLVQKMNTHSRLGKMALISVLLLSVSPATDADTPGCERDPRYPAHWWRPIRREEAAVWEILPQDAGPGEVILSKRSELGVLSNFAATPLEFRGKRYASLEGFWQMMKYPEDASDPRATFPGLTWPHTRTEVAQMTGLEAKRAGTAAEKNMKKMGITWVSFEGRRFEYKPKTPGMHYQLIVEATREKVRQNPDVQKILLATGDLVLKPDHRQEPDAPAAWRYYEILTTIRTELQKKN
jgi:predicted NAD-dependent protein-ADP-ribosyltransferase YbiA (DUF1768 family)